MADWYRCRDWDAQREAEFLRRLKRARHQKPQYLVIQALTLVETRRRELAPHALTLVDRFLQEHYEPLHASRAFHVRAGALVMMERWEEAFKAFEDALAARRVMPTIIDDAWLEYPLAIARQRARDRYSRALQILNEFQSPAALVFPIQQFT